MSTTTVAKTHTPMATNPTTYSDWRWQREHRREIVIGDERNYHRSGGYGGLTTKKFNDPEQI
jgi:hypothetical protein